MPPDSFLVCAEQMQASLIRRLGGNLRVPGVHQERGLGVRGPVLRSPAAFLASRSSREARCDNLWALYSATPDPDVAAAGHAVSHHDPSRRSLRPVHSRQVLSSLCDAHSLDTAVAQTTRKIASRALEPG